MDVREARGRRPATPRKRLAVRTEDETGKPHLRLHGMELLTRGRVPDHRRLTPVEPQGTCRRGVLFPVRAPGDVVQPAVELAQDLILAGTGEVPPSQGVVVACRQECAPVGAERQRPNEVNVSALRTYFLPVCRVPNTDGAVAETGRQRF